MSLVEFIEKYRLVKGKLVNQSSLIVPRVFPHYSPNPKGKFYSLLCKYQLLKYKPWTNNPNNAWNSEEPSDQTYINAWHEYLSSPEAVLHVPNWEEKLHDAMQNAKIDNTDNVAVVEDETSQEEWMILASFHTNGLTNASSSIVNSHDWHCDAVKYTDQQIGEMPSWITAKKETFLPRKQTFSINTESFSDAQRLAYEIVTTHSMQEKPLHLIINGEVGTGKSYLIYALCTHLKDKCKVTATTGKAAYAINGITIHSFLRLPVTHMLQKDLSGQALITIQERLTKVEYIIIDEYSMLGQASLGWIDRRCRQATGLHEVLFGGKSVIFFGDPAQLPPVGDKPLYHSKPPSAIAEQGYCAYQMFDKVVILKVNQRVLGSELDQVLFKQLLKRLRNGETTEHDWKQLLARQPSQVENIKCVEGVTRLYYSNDEVAKYNYYRLLELKQPIAEVFAKHSCVEGKNISAQQMLGLQPKLLVAKGARVMLTMNLWPSVGLCNGSTGSVVDIIYEPNTQPPSLPLAVIVKFDAFSGPSFTNNKPSCVPIPPITATVECGNVVHERQQLPLTLAWALTIHQSQGMTLNKAWVDIGKKESTLGITYVAVSRVRNISSLVIEPMTFERLQKIKNSELLKYRLKEEQRLKQLSDKTALNYSKIV
ncbi:ATP-dependent DNA helicase pif1-like [Montipora capricornis]|uniref:ATP-dependent DNA helicase pif1-like n=1 Tax=Montipora capricornis TaxID=246305 RepID=UPI0035F161DD